MSTAAHCQRYLLLSELVLIIFEMLKEKQLLAVYNQPAY